MFQDWEQRILSKPMPVHWAGFESNTYRLQQAGWEFTADQSYERMGTRLMMRHQGFQMYGCTDHVDTDFFASRTSDKWRGIRFPIQWMTGGRVQVIHEVGGEGIISAMQPVDMTPTLATAQARDIEDLNLFGAPLVRTNEVIIDPNSVPEMMDRILELQKPGAQAHYEERLREMKRGGSRIDGLRPRQEFHAQVLSLVA